MASIREKIVSIRLPGTSVKLFCAVENLGRIARAFRVRPEALGARDVLSNKSPSGRAAMLVEPFFKKSLLERDEQKESPCPTSFPMAFLLWTGSEILPDKDSGHR